MNPRLLKAGRKRRALSTSKDGYPFDPGDDHWKLNKDVTISLIVPEFLDESTREGFRAALQRYAEEMSARHTENMATD